MTTTARPFIATVPHVVEIALVAAADLAFWRAKLEPAGLSPVDRAGRAELFLSATDLRWMGKRSQEFTVGLAVRPRFPGQADTGVQDGLYLVHAFNSSRLLAFIERAFFQTPYDPAQIAARPGPPAWMQVRAAGERLFEAAMAAPAEPAAVQTEAWQGTIYLPGGQRAFQAHLGGQTEIYPFAAADTLAPVPSPAHPVSQWLAESGLAGREWRIRRDALHARTATFRRG
jgi:hypothetical protein